MKPSTHPARPEDLGPIAELFQNAFPEALTAVFNKNKLPPSAVEDCFRIIYEYEPAGLIVAKDDGRTIGFVSVVSDREEFQKSIDVKRKALQILFRWLTGRYPGIGIAFLARLPKAAWQYHHAERFSILEKPLAQYWSVVVSPAAQHQGIGMLLIHESLEYLKRTPAKAVRLEVDAAKSGPIALYKKFGFQEIGRMPSPRGTALIMTLHLKQA